MGDEQHDDVNAVQDFLNWVASDKSQLLGYRDILQDAKSPFIPYNSLKEYFTAKNRILNILIALYPEKTVGQLPAADGIGSKHLRVFSVLLRIGKGRFIDHFLRHDGLSDQYLPFKSIPNDWPHSSDANFLEPFQDQQWLFCPQSLDDCDGKKFYDERILPITHKELLGEGGSAFAHKAVVADEYKTCITRSKDVPQHRKLNLLVIKTYKKKGAEGYYTNECQAFRLMRLGKQQPNNIINFYGNYEHLGAYHIMLEFADRGSLEELIQNGTPPSSVEDLIIFWSGLLEVARGLDVIHSTQCADAKAPYILLGWHQDLKPSNILLCSSNGASKWSLTFKIADLGVSHFHKHAGDSYGLTAQATEGTRTYGAPECAKFNMAKRPNPIDQTIDIWSLGCIWSAVATWLVDGKDMVEQYRKKRQEEIKTQLQLSDSDCFHGERTALKVVRKRHRDIIANKRERDYITAPILTELVERDMLQEAPGRCHTSQLMYRSKRILAEARSMYEAAQKADDRLLALDELLEQTEVDGPSHISLRSRDANQETHIPTPQWRWREREAIAPRHEQQRPELRPFGSQEHEFRSQVLSRDRHIHKNLPTFSLNPIPEAGGMTTQADRPELEPHDLKGLRMPVPSGEDSALLGIHPGSGVVEEPEAGDIDALRARLRSAKAHEATVDTTSPKRRTQMMETSHLRTNSMSSGIMPFGLMPNVTDSHPQPPIPYLSVEQGLAWKRRRDKGEDTRRPMNLEVLERLKYREHVFLVDHAASMETYQMEVRNVLELLTCIAAGFDPNRIELYFSTSSERLKPKTNAEVLAEFDRRPYAAYGHEPDFKLRVDSIIGPYQKKLGATHRWKAFWDRDRPKFGPRKMSIIVLTDGVWWPKCDISKTIKILIHKLIQHDLTVSQIGIQFIHFGNDPREGGRLQKLDTGLNLDLDIVDTTRAGENVIKMMGGHVNELLDDDPENEPTTPRSALPRQSDDPQPQSANTVTTPGKNQISNSLPTKPFVSHAPGTKHHFI